MENNTISVFEHTKLYIGERGFEKRHFNALVKYNDSHGGKYFAVGYKSITFKSYVGVIQASDKIIEILPKADMLPGNDASIDKWQSALLIMLEKAGYIRLNQTEKAFQGIKRRNLLDLYIFSFLKEIEKLLHAGLIKKYRRIRKNGTVLKGKLLVEKQILYNTIHKERFYTEHTIYDRNNLLNRILKRALDILAKTSTNSTIRSEVTKQLMFFEEIEACSGTQAEFKHLVFDRKSAAYSYAIELARMIILNYNPDMTSGATSVLAILFDMNRLFEKYIYSILKEQESTFSEFRLAIREQNSFLFWKDKTLRPDLIITFTKQIEEDIEIYCKIVVDTKWKVIDAVSPADDDLKQMFTYNLQTGSERSVLLYPYVNQISTTTIGNYEKGLAAPAFNHMCELYFAELFDQSTGQVSSYFGIDFLKHLLAIKY